MGSPWHHNCAIVSSSGKTALSVVIPCWNSVETVKMCLNAISRSSLNRAYPSKLEVIVCDDGSDDGVDDGQLASLYRRRDYHFSLVGFLICPAGAGGVRHAAPKSKHGVVSLCDVGADTLAAVDFPRSHNDHYLDPAYTHWGQHLLKLTSLGTAYGLVKDFLATGFIQCGQLQRCVLAVG